MAQQFTQKFIDRFVVSKLEEGVPYKELNDIVAKGLSIRKGKRGATYYFTRQVKGLPRKRYKIGDARILSLKQAREKAYLFYEDVPSDSGHDGDMSYMPVGKYINEVYGVANTNHWNLREASYQFDETILRLEMMALKPAHIQDWVNRRVNGAVKQAIFTKGGEIELRNTLQKVKPETARRGYAALRAIFNWAKERGHIPYNPITGVRVQGASERQGRRMSDDDYAMYLVALRSIPNKRLKCFLFLLITTGARPREVLTLRRENISLIDEKPSARVDASFAKTKKERVLHLRPETVAMLHEYMGSKDDKRLPNGRESEWLFYSPRTGTHVKSMYKTYKTWARTNPAAEDMPEYDLYAFRHTFAYQVHKTSSLTTTRDLMGHANIQTTDKYLKSSSDEQWDAVNAVVIDSSVILNKAYQSQAEMKSKVKALE